jgi:superfamily II DNA/RNA helicase
VLQGADFPNVELVINFLSPTTLEIWIQRAGRGARSRLIICRCVIMLTKTTIKKAVQICKDAHIEVAPELIAIKAEAEDEDEEIEEVEEVEEVVAAPTKATKSKDTKSTKGRRAAGKRNMSLPMAEYIATQECRTAVIDREFKNPPHPSCYEVGGCDICIEQRKRDEDYDRLAPERQAIKQEDQGNTLDEQQDLPRKKPQATKLDTRVTAERKDIKGRLVDWRKTKLADISKLYYTHLESIMTNKEIDKIAKALELTEPASFDRLDICWPGELAWRLEVLDIIKTTDDEFARQRAEKEAEKERRAENARMQAEKQAEKERKKAEQEAAEREATARQAARCSTPR